MWWCQFIDLLKFETRPSSLLNFGMANSVSMFTPRERNQASTIERIFPGARLQREHEG